MQLISQQWKLRNQKRECDKPEHALYVVLRIIILKIYIIQMFVSKPSTSYLKNWLLLLMPNKSCTVKCVNLTLYRLSGVRNFTTSLYWTRWGGLLLITTHRWPMVGNYLSILYNGHRPGYAPLLVSTSCTLFQCSHMHTNYKPESVIDKLRGYSAEMRK